MHENLNKINVIFNVDAITAPLTGIGHYALNLAHGLQTHPDIHQCKLYSAYRWVNSPTHALQANRGLAMMRQHVPLKQLALHSYNFIRNQLFRLKLFHPKLERNG